ncbi:glycyl-tRNA synthetase beta chain [Rhizomicrobium palustre]|uniref:Glycine--tRNA ligase beta subunit n=1 Tax=Rhizomicrobium palustre TaxID=189966 RepID=A0A846N2C6_9PROT|nr:glycine--tRNA ligase subunit beta [Rhizomicrobium palustre]NIK90144.1 glycyl-tRNA synthetase beta chain [Rhizomicrobium palustre]
MADLLLELFSEEIPARMQAQAAKDLERLVVGALSDRGLLFEGSKAFAGPRRLTLVCAGLPVKQPDVSEEKKGPRITAPEKAIEGFLRSAGVTLEQCEKRDDGKGEFYVAVIHRKGRDTAEVLAEVIPECMAKLPWPKSMRWIPGEATRWVRPLHSILCTLGGEVVPFEFAGVKSGKQTRGHRFLSAGVITANSFEMYRADLKHHHVMLDAADRKETILEQAKTAAFALGLELIEDEGLLEEVAGLNEWPTVLIGRIEDQFMDVPAEILQTSMRTHQKYFSLRDPKTGKFANRFAVVSNMVAEDGGAAIIAGNERVLRARLSDAKFFWDLDRQTKLADRVDALKGITFHAKLGTQYERVMRIVALAGEIAAKIGADVEKAKRAALLCKADLTTGVVGEFPELQGVMGRYYAIHDGEDAEVADAIRDHYKPVGPSDAVPTSKVSIAVALADKLDQLVWFFRYDEKPTGSGDPFALRRAALGVIRLILENKLFLPLTAHTSQADYYNSEKGIGRIVHSELLTFFADRLKVALKEKGTRYDLIDAVFSLGNEDDLVRLVARVEALQSFLKTEAGTNLLAGYKRAANILKAEEKKDKTTYEGEAEASALVLEEEMALFAELQKAAGQVKADIEAERFVEAMGVMAGLRAPVDAFFDKVTVNDKDASLRKNRLLLLSQLRATLHLVADFSKIEG